MSDKKEDMRQKENAVRPGMDAQGEISAWQKDETTGGNGKKAGYVIAVIFATVLGMAVGAGGTLFLTRGSIPGRGEAAEQVRTEETGGVNVTGQDGAVAAGADKAEGDESSARACVESADMCMELAIQAVTRLAQSSFESGEYADALTYYGRMLEWEDTAAEAYRKSAEIHLALGEYEDAAAVLNEGIERIREEDAALLLEQLVEVYLRESEAWLSDGDYEQAYAVLREGAEATGAAVLSERERSLENMSLAEACFEAGEYEEALAYYGNVLEEDDSLAEAYRKSAQIYLVWGDYENAEAVLSGGIVKSREEDAQSLREQLVGVYLLESDAQLAAGDYEQAYAVLLEGAEAADAENLLDRAQDVREKVKLVREEYDRTEYSGYSVYEYDTAGHLIRKGFTDPLLTWEEYEYDAVGNLIKKVWYDEDGSISGWAEYEYDAVGDLIREVNHWHDVYEGIDYEYDYEWEYDYEYDNFGNLIRKDTLGPTGGTCVEYAYDVSGNLIKKTDYGSGGMDGWYEYEYDAVGSLIKEVRYNEGGSISGWMEYEYDAVGSLIKEVRYNEGGSICWWEEYEYDSFGNLIKGVSYDEDGRVFGWEEYTYAYIGN